MILLGLILIVVAVAAGTVLVLATQSLTEPVELAAGNQVSVVPLILVIAGAAVLFVLWLGLAMVRGSIRRKTRRRKEAKEAQRQAELEAEARREEEARRADEARREEEIRREAEERAQREAEERRAADERWQQTPAAGTAAGTAARCWCWCWCSEHEPPPRPGGPRGGDTAVMEPAVGEQQEARRHARTPAPTALLRARPRPTTADRIMGRPPGRSHRLSPGSTDDTQHRAARPGTPGASGYSGLGRVPAARCSGFQFRPQFTAAVTPASRAALTAASRPPHPLGLPSPWRSPAQGTPRGSGRSTDTRTLMLSSAAGEHALTSAPLAPAIAAACLQAASGAAPCCSATAAASDARSAEAWA